MERGVAQAGAAVSRAGASGRDRTAVRDSGYGPGAFAECVRARDRGMFAGELIPGEAVGIEFRLPQAPDSLRTRAMVRYQDSLRCGLEFVGLSGEQRAAIRDWAKGVKAETEIPVTPASKIEKQDAYGGGGGSGSGGGGRGKPKRIGRE